MRRFNTTGLCVPSKHYMVSTDGRVRQIRAMVEEGDYFSINRGRQYGKTTTLFALEGALSDAYGVISLDFQRLGSEEFAGEHTFATAFVTLLELTLSHARWASQRVFDVLEAMSRAARDVDFRLLQLFVHLSRLIAASDRPLVLIIDEVDSATNNQVFLDFLAQLRLQYLEREKNPDASCFQSVILAGVTDVRHLRAKIRDQDQHKVNSPWNIAARFEVEMGFTTDEVAQMLSDYESDHGTGMDAAEIATQVEAYTHGYPFLVSRLCQIMDEKLVGDDFEDLAAAWTPYGVDEAVRRLLSETNALFEGLCA